MALVLVPSAPSGQVVDDVDGIVPRGWHCSTGPTACCACRWKLHNKQWSRRLASMHRPEQSPILVSPSRRRFSVGCTTCRAAKVKDCQFSSFEVETLSCFQIGYFMRHVSSPKHRLACQKLSIEVLAEDKTVHHVPPVSHWLWSLRICFSASSFRDYKKFINCAEMPVCPDEISELQSGNWHHSNTAKSCNHCLASVEIESNQEFLRHSVRIAMASDDRAQARFLRVKAVRANPVVQIKSFIGDLVKNYGYSVEDCANAHRLAIQGMCTVRKGVRDDALSGGSDYVDQPLVKHVQDNTVCFATDGCEVEIKAVQLLKHDMKGLRYQFRDKCHTTQTCCRATHNFLRDADKQLQELLISGPHSFAKRVT